MIKNCARCLGKHKLTFVPLKGEPIEGKDGNYTHWAMCPLTEQPIVLMVLGQVPLPL
jgi:hypothetical protein